MNVTDTPPGRQREATVINDVIVLCLLLVGVWYFYSNWSRPAGDKSSKAMPVQASMPVSR